MAVGVHQDRGDAALLRHLQARFAQIAGEDRLIDPEELRRALGIQDPIYSQRLFALADSDGSGRVERGEFLAFAERFLQGSVEDKLRLIFELHDRDGTGAIERHELAEMLDASLNEHHLELSPAQLEQLCAAMLDGMDRDGDQAISFAEFKAVCDDYPDLSQRMTASAATWLRPPARRRRPLAAPPVPWRKGALKQARRSVENNLAKIVLLALYGALNATLFIQAMEAYAAAGANITIQIARGAGACCYLNGGLILLPMLRHLMTRARHSPLGRAIPFDSAIAFHKLVGHVLFAMAGLHTAAHALNYLVRGRPGGGAGRHRFFPNG